MSEAPIRQRRKRGRIRRWATGRAHPSRGTRTRLFLLALFLAATPTRVDAEPSNSGAPVETPELARRAGRAIEAAQASAARGNYGAAVEHIERELFRTETEERTSPLPAAIEASLRGARGTHLLAAAGPEPALAELRAARALARTAGAFRTEAAIAHNLGDALMASDDPASALAAYRDAERIADEVGAPLLGARAAAGASRALLTIGPSPEVLTALEGVRDRLAGLPPGRDVAALGVHYAETLGRWPEPTAPFGDATVVAERARALTRAATVAHAAKDERLVSEAWGELARTYSERGRREEAAELLARARMRAERVEAPDLLVRWATDSARLHRARGDAEAALEDYAEAVEALDSVRFALPHQYGRARTTFRASASGVYFEYVDLLLARAAANGDPPEDLARAQRTIERLKAAELRDYFRDECVDDALEAKVDVSEVALDAAIIYPILFDDRIEILVSQGGERFRRSAPVARERVNAEVARFRALLQQGTTRRYRRPAKALHEWLIAPIEADLAERAPSVLVFVPDGALRTIPMAALHDGERFLIERYAVALTPGLELSQPTAITREGARAFLGGVTESVQGFPALPHVGEELAAIATYFESEVQLDTGFRRDTIEAALAERPFNIVHLASHAAFDPDSRDTFILTHDGRISMDDLAGYVGRFRFRERPLDLLVLSACETAAGDERAALGLSGLAVKAGARSALGSLWPVNDAATRVLLERFYGRLQEPGTTRAEALRDAQRTLIADRQLRHPLYWSPFLLINDWL
ncbi:MAG: CHAT domain-containing protein [bacterium]|nr:CHAT domain-containing protein [bacterium]